MIHQSNRDSSSNNTSGEQEKQEREVDIIVDDKDRDDEEGDKKRTWCENEACDAHRTKKVKGYQTQDVSQNTSSVITFCCFRHALLFLFFLSTGFLLCNYSARQE